MRRVMGSSWGLGFWAWEMRSEWSFTVSAKSLSSSALPFWVKGVYRILLDEDLF